MPEPIADTPLRRPQQHQEIAAYLRDEIFGGRIPVGHSLPSEAELCTQFDSSRGPVRQAVATLRSEGLISSGRGRRSIVLSATRTETFAEVLSTSAWITRLGQEPGQRLVHFGPAPASAEVAAALGIEENTDIVTLRRVRTADGRPAVAEDVAFSPSITQVVLSIDPEAESMHHALIRAGVNYNNISRAASIGTATDDDVADLEVDHGAPILRAELQAFTHTGEPVEYAVRRYRTDGVVFGLNSVRGHSSPLWVALDDEVHKEQAR